MSFIPELGQMAFGRPWEEHGVPDIMDAALQYIRYDLERVLGNLTQQRDRYNDPFGNYSSAFRCDVFGVWGYDWSEDREQPYNFFHVPTGLRISWYKYSGRGMSSDREITPDLAAEVLESCMAALGAVEDAGARCQTGGIWEVPYFEEPKESASSADPI